MDDQFAQLMGFTSFGSKKQAKKIDFMEMFEEAYATAKHRNLDNNTKAMQELENVSTNFNKSILINKDNLCLDKPTEVNESDDENNSDVEDTNPNDDDPYFIPDRDNIKLCHGSKQITSLAVDPSGARVATAGLEFDVKLWDFGGMDSSCRAFKAVHPCEDHEIHLMEFSPSGDNILMINGSAQARIVSREGDIKCICVKGYQYITDPASAKGHTHALTGGAYHPIDGSTILTSSYDTTLRLWNIEETETILLDTKIPGHKSVIKPKSSQGRRTTPTACAFSKDGFSIAAGCTDGSLQIWDTRRPLINTSAISRTAFPVGTEVSSIAWSWDSRHIVTRVMDDTVRLFDVRKLPASSVGTNAKQAYLACLGGLPVFYPHTQVSFSPNDQMFVTGVAAPKNAMADGRMAFFRRDNFELIKNVKPGHGSVNCLYWHPRIGQIFCGCSDGTVTVHYDASRGTRELGAIRCASREITEASRRRRIGEGDAFIRPTLLFYDEDDLNLARKTKKGRQATLDALSAPTPALAESMLALVAVNATRAAERQATMDLLDKDVKARSRAKNPEKAEEKGNKVGSLHQYMVQQIVLRPNESDKRAEADIRGAILRHDEASKKPFWTKAYVKNQPKTIFQNPDEDVQPDSIPTWKKKKLA